MYDLLKFNTDVHTRIGRLSKLNLACPRFNRGAEGGREDLQRICDKIVEPTTH